MAFTTVQYHFTENRLTNAMYSDLTIVSLNARIVLRTSKFTMKLQSFFGIVEIEVPFSSNGIETICSSRKELFTPLCQCSLLRAALSVVYSWLTSEVPDRCHSLLLNDTVLPPPLTYFSHRNGVIHSAGAPRCGQSLGTAKCSLEVGR